MSKIGAKDGVLQGFKEMKPSSLRAERFRISFPFQDHEFQFLVWNQPLSLGDDEWIQYYWMDCYPKRENESRSRAQQAPGVNAVEKEVTSRDLNNKIANENFVQMIKLHGATLCDMNLSNDLGSLDQNLMGLAFYFVAGNRSLQDVYNDAFLRPGLIKRLVQNGDVSLNDSDLSRIKNIISKKSFSKIQSELDNILGKFHPPKELIDSNQEEFGRLIGSGRGLLKNKGIQGVEEYCQILLTYIEQNRKRGNNELIRGFINVLCYNLKVSFYSIFSNAWSYIIPWLKENRGLDSKSEAFLRFWHNQSPPYPLPKGNLVKYFYEVQTQHWEGPPAKSNRKATIESGGNRLNNENPYHLRDYFNGQVLSLHPLSGVFMNDKAMLASAGRFFCTKDYENTLGSGRFPDCESFWNLMREILISAKIYKNIRDEQNSQRIKHPIEIQENTKSNKSKNDAKKILLKYFNENRLHCNSCNGNWDIKSFEECFDEEIYYSVHLFCKKCKNNKVVDLNFNDLNISKIIDLQ